MEYLLLAVATIISFPVVDPAEKPLDWNWLLIIIIVITTTLVALLSLLFLSSLLLLLSILLFLSSVLLSLLLYRFGFGCNKWRVF